MALLTKSNGEPRFPSYVFSNALVTVLFFLWGFSYGLLDTLNKHFQNVLKISKLIIIIKNLIIFFLKKFIDD